MASPYYGLINNNLGTPGLNTVNNPNAKDLGFNLDDLLYRNKYVQYMEKNILEPFAKTDCTKVTTNFLFNMAPDGTEDVVTKYYSYLTDEPPLNRALSWLKGALTPEPHGTIKGIFSVICRKGIISLTYLSNAVEGILKLASYVFKKIDDLIKLIHGLLSEFINILANCLTKIIEDTRNTINKLLDSALNFDALNDLFVADCPCINTIIANLFCCQFAEGHCGSDSRNKTRLNSPAEIIACVRKKVGDATGLTFLRRKINEFLDDATSMIFKALGFLVKKMQKYVNSLMRMLNNLMKQWCEWITRKFDVSALVKMMGPADCLLIYTKEYTKAGIPFKGMSVIDMVDTLKMWKNCLKTLCGGFSAMADYTLKQTMKNHRLAFTYWNDILTMDYYLSCYSFDVDETVARAQYVVQNDQSPEKAKNLAENVKGLDFPDQIQLPETNEQILNVTLGTSDSNADFNLSQGQRQFFPTVENNLISWSKSLVTQLDSIEISEAITEMLDFESAYIKSKENIQTMENINQLQNSSTSSILGQGTNVYQVEQISVGLETGDLLSNQKNYKLSINETVDELKVEKILNMKNINKDGKSIDQLINEYYQVTLS